jgi:hypothetical protein
MYIFIYIYIYIYIYIICINFVLGLYTHTHTHTHTHTWAASCCIFKLPALPRRAQCSPGVVPTEQSLGPLGPQPKPLMVSPWMPIHMPYWPCSPPNKAPPSKATLLGNVNSIVVHFNTSTTEYGVPKPACHRTKRHAPKPQTTPSAPHSTLCARPFSARTISCAPAQSGSIRASFSRAAKMCPLP